jgi:agmatine/peptidylarginine deiminase
MPVGNSVGINQHKVLYQVHRVPGWSDNNDNEAGGTWYTYTDSLIVGNTVIVSSFYNQELNVQAQSVYQMAARHLKVEFVNADEIVHYGGAVHCLTTREVPALLLDDQSVAATPPLLVIL